MSTRLKEDELKSLDTSTLAKLIIEEPCIKCDRITEIVDDNLCEPCHIATFCECGKRFAVEDGDCIPERGEYGLCRRCD